MDSSEELVAIGNRKRWTVGLVIDDIALVGGQKALRGMVDLAKEKDINFLCYHLNLNDNLEQLPVSWDSIRNCFTNFVIDFQNCQW